MAYEAPALKPPHPVAFDVAYPEHLSRIKIFFKIFLAIPQLIVLYLLFIPLGVLTFLAWFAILFTGRYPKGFFDFTSGVLRWMANVTAYCVLLRDEYPPFSWEPGVYPLQLDIPYPERLSRLRLFFRIFAVVPNQFVFYFVQQAALFTTFLSWFAILFTGRYPRGLFKFSVGTLRWYERQAAYIYLLRDEYPPYSINADARPGNEIVSLVVGVPLFFVFVAIQFLPFVGLLRTDTDTVRVESSLTSQSQLRREAPTGEANSTRVTIASYDDDGFLPRASRTQRLSGYRIVIFHIRAEKTGNLPALFSPYFFRLHDCFDTGYSPVDVSAANTTNFAFGLWWFRGHAEGDVYFQIPRGNSACNLIYHAGLGEVHFNFPH
jgi:hypothetical protein